jgi:hypothetical protein
MLVIQAKHLPLLREENLEIASKIPLENLLLTGSSAFASSAATAAILKDFALQPHLPCAFQRNLLATSHCSKVTLEKQLGPTSRQATLHYPSLLACLLAKAFLRVYYFGKKHSLEKAFPTLTSKQASL